MDSRFGVVILLLAISVTLVCMLTRRESSKSGDGLGPKVAKSLTNGMEYKGYEYKGYVMVFDNFFHQWSCWKIC